LGKFVRNVLCDGSKNLCNFFSRDAFCFVDDISNHLLRSCAGRDAAKNALQSRDTRKFARKFKARLNGCTQGVLTRVKSALQAVLPCLIGGVGDAQNNGRSRSPDGHSRNRNDARRKSCYSKPFILWKRRKQLLLLTVELT
jgi:hypothetical protein